MLITEILQNSSFELKLIEQLITHLSKQLDDEKIMLNLKFLLSSSWISKNGMYASWGSSGTSRCWAMICLIWNVSRHNWVLIKNFLHSMDFVIKLLHARPTRIFKAPSIFHIPASKFHMVIAFIVAVYLKVKVFW